MPKLKICTLCFIELDSQFKKVRGEWNYCYKCYNKLLIMPKAWYLRYTRRSDGDTVYNLYLE